jgi:two-component system, cell cycle response regulator
MEAHVAHTPSRTSSTSSGWSLSAFLRGLWRRPESEISDLAFSGELLVAGVRLLLVVVLLYFPARDYLPRLISDAYGLSSGLSARRLTPLLAVAGLGLLGALMVYATVSRKQGRSWIGFASSVFDVSLVSCVLLTFVLFGDPLNAVADPLIFPAYLLAVAATALRYDTRISLVAGILALAQYGGLAAVAYQVLPAALRDGWSGWLQAGRLALLAAVTLLAATVVVRSHELRLLSTRDRFTGLLNRAVFDERLERESLLALREGYRFAVAMVDIDHFKIFNDSHGHTNGDQALRQVAQALRESCRATDIVARYGGEEFALILPGVRRDAAHSLLERIRRKVAVMPIRLTGRRKLVSVTVSIGVASWPEDGAAAEEILASADRRLYQAKQLGRDRVVGPPAAKARSLAEQGIVDLDATWTAPLTPPD